MGVACRWAGTIGTASPAATRATTSPRPAGAKCRTAYRGGRVPVGWGDWYGISGGHESHDLNENGRIHSYDPQGHHLDDVLAGKAAGSVRRSGEGGPPFFMWVGTQAPHAPAEPAPRHE